MSKELRLIIAEDSEDDCQQLLYELKRGGFIPRFEVLETAEAMRACLYREPWELVVSDYSMPQFTCLDALDIMRESGLDIPFIVWSGTAGEQKAVDAMRAGAADFITKGNLTRLVPAIQRELREAAMRAERKKMHEQLLFTDRMVSVGTLAAGVAHEINNPLAVVSANLEMSVERLVASGAGSLQEVQAILREAREAADRIRGIVQDLRSLSRPDEEQLGAIDVHRVLDSSIRIAWNEIRHRADLIKDYGDVPPVHANEAKLGQVFLNLFINAAQAIPEGMADKNQIRIRTTREDFGYVTVEISDTGSGIPNNILHRIFDPFFTTKPIGVGTGLGLAICHRIVASLGGEIRVDSKLGQGTVFRVALPASRQKPVNDDNKPTKAPQPAKRRGQILVIDDEQMLCSALKRMLSPEHDVTTMTSAIDALKILKEGTSYDVILCDLMMPMMTGIDLYMEIQQSRPELTGRLIFMTGGAFTDRAQEFLNRVPNMRLDKPVNAQNLRALINSLVS